MDTALLLWLNQQLASSQEYFYLALMISNRIPWIVMSLLLCWLWFVGAEGLLPKRPGGILNMHARHMAISAILALPVLFICSQLIQHAIARPRPLHQDELLTIPVTPQQWQLIMDAFTPLTAFPSDHAIVVGLLLACVWHISRWMSLAAALLLLPTLIIRIALGFHWPSDILAGLLLGGLFGAVISFAMPWQLTLTQRLNHRLQQQPAWFNVALFLFFYDFSQKFSWLFTVGEQLRSWL